MVVGRPGVGAWEVASGDALCNCAAVAGGMVVGGGMSVGPSGCRRRDSGGESSAGAGVATSCR